jgi:hypothetical protein
MSDETAKAADSSPVTGLTLRTGDGRLVASIGNTSIAGGDLLVTSGLGPTQYAEALRALLAIHAEHMAVAHLALLLQGAVSLEATRVLAATELTAPAWAPHSVPEGGAKA